MRPIVILFTLLLSFQSFSQPNPNTQKLLLACDKIDAGLNEILSNNPGVDEFCTPAIIRAQTYLKFAALKIEQGYYPLAVINLLTVEKTLRNVVLLQESCATFGPLVKPFIPIVIAIKNEIDEDLTLN